MGEELRTVGPPTAVTVWFCGRCNEIFQGAASNVFECDGEPERLRYVRAESFASQISDLMWEARLNDLTLQQCHEYARRLVSDWDGAS